MDYLSIVYFYVIGIQRLKRQVAESQTDSPEHHDDEDHDHADEDHDEVCFPIVCHDHRNQV